MTIESQALLANRHLIFILFCLFCILSCSTNPSMVLPKPTTQIVKKAEEAGFSLQRYETPTFILTTYELDTTPNPICHIYIEGDGNSWKTKHRLSNNPTPKQPLALQLALQDQHPQVIYIARPCQFTPLAIDSSCAPKYWSSHRYAPEVIEAFQATLNQIKLKKKDTRFLLIGFSGGASVAALIASNRSDVVGLITVAGDLNHVALNRHHQTSPLTGSLNPMDVTEKVEKLPQSHWSASHDAIVPTWIAQQFAKKVNNPSCCQVHILTNASHHAGWVEKWPEIIQSFLECSNPSLSGNV
ncbi:alpha/beta fold hydrolase [Candidatus Berkiella aquae]|uniref:Alpha/beta hydrolase family protein n=2 Tax=Candidatus Berkiella aquae TaxID=295108 RepID=A0AAE3HYK3_9GAMM|nr:hypothetical protein [Candidatus Berkiella aquae]MCS5712131.1 hypothetical protein [Candidatus Berkiella aquae]